MISHKEREIKRSQFPTRIAKSFAGIARGDIVRQTDFCVAFFEVLTEKERNDEADLAFAKFICALGCKYSIYFHFKKAYNLSVFLSSSEILGDILGDV